MSGNAMFPMSQNTKSELNLGCGVGFDGEVWVKCVHKKSSRHELHVPAACDRGSSSGERRAHRLTGGRQTA